MAVKDGKSYANFTKRLPSMVSRFGGEYIAMIEGKVVAHGRDAKRVYDRARHEYPKARIFLGQVPTRQAMVPFLRKDFHSQRASQKSERSEQPSPPRKYPTF